jgi:hypothetical protein
MPNEARQRLEHQLLLALACGATIEVAARTLGVSESTVRRRVREKRFAARLTQMRSEMSVRVADQLTAASTEGARTMVELMKQGNPPSVRLGASKAVVELSMRARENADLQHRMAELERRLDGQTKVRQRRQAGRRSGPPPEISPN